MNPISYFLDHKSILLILFVALLLRLPLLNGSFWLDEAAQALESTRPLNQQFEIQYDFQPPLFHLAVHFFSYLSHADWWLRLASLIPGLITIYLTYLIGRLIINRQTGLLAALFLATSQFHIFYSQELRPYSFATMFALLSIYSFQKMQPHSLFSISYILFTTLGMYSVYTFPFLILAQTVYVLVYKRIILKSYLINLISVSVLCLPWLPSFWGQFTTGMGVTESLPLWKTAVSPIPFKALFLLAPKWIFGRLDLPNEPIALAFLGLILAGVGLLLLFRRRYQADSWLYFWLIIPVILGFIISFKVPLLEPKRFLFCLPAIYLLLASSSHKLKHLIMLINLIGLVLYWSLPQFQREPWMTALQELEAQVNPQTVVIFPWDAPYAPYTWYTDNQVRTISFAPLPVTSESVTSSLSQLDSDQNLIYFDYLESITDPAGIIRTQLTQSNWQETGFQIYPGIGKVRQYSYQKE